MGLERLLEALGPEIDDVEEGKAIFLSLLCSLCTSAPEEVDLLLGTPQ